ncbi:MAG: hypothetical protein V7K21_07735 [Nostoc sp.]|uniref:hypothetical protein n=1 Tax=Nostoc sp. TaxID=1180 RepID=UPI002FF8CD73
MSLNSSCPKRKTGWVKAMTWKPKNEEGSVRSQLVRKVKTIHHNPTIPIKTIQGRKVLLVP